MEQETLRANFKEMKIGNEPDIDRQERVLKALICLCSLKDKKPIAIDLQYCAALNSKMLIPFLHENLNYLALSYCPQIGNNDLKLIQKSVLISKSCTWVAV